MDNGKCHPGYTSKPFTMGTSIPEDLSQRKCSMFNGGGIDEKTWRKKIWPLIESIAQLEDRVVSEYVCLIKNVILFFLTSILDSI